MVIYYISNYSINNYNFHYNFLAIILLLIFRKFEHIDVYVYGLTHL